MVGVSGGKVKRGGRNGGVGRYCAIRRRVFAVDPCNDLVVINIWDAAIVNECSQNLSVLSSIRSVELYGIGKLDMISHYGAIDMYGWDYCYGPLFDIFRALEVVHLVADKYTDLSHHTDKDFWDNFSFWAVKTVTAL